MSSRNTIIDEGFFIRDEITWYCFIYKVCFVKSAPSIFETFCVRKDPISATPYHSSFNIINYTSIKLWTVQYKNLYVGLSQTKTLKDVKINR